MKYRSYDTITNTRALVRTIDFQWQKVQLVPPDEKCHLKWIRVFDQVLFERCFEVRDIDGVEIYTGDIVLDTENSKEYILSSVSLLWNEEDQKSVYFDYMNSNKYRVIGQIPYDRK